MIITKLFQIFTKPLVILSILIAAFILLSNIFLLKIPPVWPDEALHADIAYNILKENRVGTDLWKGLVSGVENHGFGYPPLFFYLTAAWFGIFGFSITAQRLLSVTISVLFIICFYFFIKSTLREKGHKLDRRVDFFALLACVPLVLDQAFLKSVHIGRPEILVLLLGTLSVVLFLKGKGGRGIVQIILFMLAGISLGLSFTSHFTAAIFSLAIFLYIFITDRWTLLKSRNFYIFLCSFLFPIMVWIITILPTLATFMELVNLQKQVKDTTMGWLRLLFITESLSVKLTYLLYIAITWEFITYLIINRAKKYLLLGLLLISSWLFPLIWKHEFSFVYLIPFVFASLTVLASESSIQKPIKYRWKRFLYPAIFILVIFLNTNILRENINLKGGDSYSYEKFIRNILSIIPSNKTVYLISIPDAYFGLKNSQQNTLYEFPMIATKKENYLKVLNNSDYIVFSSPFEQHLFGNLLFDYMEKNSLRTYHIGEKDQYQVEVIKLKPKQERVNPSI